MSNSKVGDVWVRFYGERFFLIGVKQYTHAANSQWGRLTEKQRGLRRLEPQIFNFLPVSWEKNMCLVLPEIINEQCCSLSYHPLILDSVFFFFFKVVCLLTCVQCLPTRLYSIIFSVQPSASFRCCKIMCFLWAAFVWSVCVCTFLF